MRNDPHSSHRRPRARTPVELVKGRLATRARGSAHRDYFRTGHPPGARRAGPLTPYSANHRTARSATRSSTVAAAWIVSGLVRGRVRVMAGQFLRARHRRRLAFVLLFLPSAIRYFRASFCPLGAANAQNRPAVALQSWANLAPKARRLRANGLVGASGRQGDLVIVVTVCRVQWLGSG